MTARQQRWMVCLDQFDLEIRYKPGREHVVADALSRRPEIQALQFSYQAFEDDILKKLEAATIGDEYSSCPQLI